MNAAQQQDAAGSVDAGADREQNHREAIRVNAIARLSFARQLHPELRRAEATARVDLAAAIVAMDTVENRVEAGEKRHSLNEQAAVEQATRNYAEALARLIRGEAG